MAERTLNHFALFTFTEAFWSLPATERAAMPAALLADLKPAAPQASIYQVFPARADADFLLWSALPVEQKSNADVFFRCFAQAINARRRLLRPIEALWGFTRPSVYARGQSAQEMDPFAPERQPYLVVYPFTKTKEWYLMSKDARQGIMNEHIRTGHQYPEIKQLLLYSFGLQDQEFVVVYGTDDLTEFSGLVNDLRSVEGRRYTERDTPVTTGLYCTPAEAAALWGATQ